MSRESARSAFLEHEDTHKKRLWRAWYVILHFCCVSYSYLIISHKKNRFFFLRKLKTGDILFELYSNVMNLKPQSRHLNGN